MHALIRTRAMYVHELGIYYSYPNGDVKGDDSAPGGMRVRMYARI